MSINCEILDLRAFLLVVELESFHRAAEALNLSQPALSRRIQKLEASIGAPLLERTTRHVAATAMGEELVPLVRRMLEEFDGSLFASQDSAERRGGLVTIACLPTAAFYFLPSVIREFNARYRNIRFRILDLPATEGLQAVSRGEVEFGINIMGSSDPDLVFDRLVEDPFVLAARKDHPLSERSSLTWADLSPYQLITVHRSSANRILLDSMLARSNLALRWSYEVTHLSTSLGLVEAGLGISVLPRMATPQGEHPFLITRPIKDPEISRTIGVVRRRGAMLSPAADRFLSILISTWGDRPSTVSAPARPGEA
ncbi:LysR family transcriptional regulator [Amaricoccus solimangrovi]|uniref:LysR family transcriptional regulator n=1 Tax=Amaricoccus solimangrovi TaxID=2589815 RepID=A0A501WER1_9RHOB|nr:LysR family transcriptional regulator [Amaricoccus solimangrovi]TPE46985.1 LysR family transcriptional regulator [Amaricoccus solimangrovi]